MDNILKKKLDTFINNIHEKFNNHNSDSEAHTGYLVNKNEIADDLNTDDSMLVLSARQGKLLNDRIDEVLDYVNDKLTPGKIVTFRAIHSQTGEPIPWGINMDSESYAFDGRDISDLCKRYEIENGELQLKLPEGYYYIYYGFDYPYHGDSDSINTREYNVFEVNEKWIIRRYNE